MGPHAPTTAENAPQSPSPQKSDTQIDLDAHVQEEADALFHTLVHEAINIPGDHGIPHKDIVVGLSELELAKLREGRAFFHRNYFGCAWAIVFTELVQYPIQRITGFVVRNDNYNGPNFAYLRGVVTFMHILKWFERNVENPSADSAQDIYKVRKIHEGAIKRLSGLPVPPPNIPKKDRMHVLEAIRQDMAHIPTPDYLPSIMTANPSVPISQFDMAMVLGVFYFLLDVNPKVAGLYTDKGYESYIYYLGIIGRYLGMEDRFNLALHPNPVVRKAVSKRYWEDIITPCFKNFQEPEFLNLCYFAEHGFWLNPFEISTHMLIKDILGVPPAKNTFAHVNLFYRCLYKILKLGFYLVRFRLFLFPANISMRLWLWIGIVTTRGMRRNSPSTTATPASAASCDPASKNSQCPV